VDFRIQGAAPTLTFEDTTTGDDDYRLKVDTFGVPKLQFGASWDTRLQCDGTNVYVNNSLGAGDETSSHAVRWERVSGTTSTTTNNTTVSLSLSNRAWTAVIMLQSASGSSTYNGPCYGEVDDSAAKYALRVTQSGSGDSLTILHDGSDYSGGRSYYGLVFYKP
jgi:hypothetical protein